MAKKAQKPITKNQIFRALGLTSKMKGASYGGEWFADSKDYGSGRVSGLAPDARAPARRDRPAGR